MKSQSLGTDKDNLLLVLLQVESDVKSYSSILHLVLRVLMRIPGDSTVH